MRALMILLASGMAGIAVVLVLICFGAYLPAAGACLFALGLMTAAFVQALRKSKTMAFLRAQTKPVKSKERQEQNRLLEKRIELSIFENQINPHFLYNTLDSIRGEALCNDQKEIAAMIENLSRFFRYCISSKGRIVKISEELNNVRDYYQIQKYRFGDRIELTTEIEDEAILEYYIPKITIQPIVENAIAHGIETSGRKGSVHIRMGATDKKVYIHILDNGEGMSEETLVRLNERLKNNLVEVRSADKKHSGIAVQNINSRIRICFGDEYGLHYRSIKGEGTDVTVVLPLINDFKRGAFERKLEELM